MTEIVRCGTKGGHYCFPKNFPGLDDKSTFYCMGSGEDISTEIKICKDLGCKVYVFDSSPGGVNHVKYVKNVLKGTAFPRPDTEMGSGDPDYWSLVMYNKIHHDDIVISCKEIYNKNGNIGFRDINSRGLVSNVVITDMGEFNTNCDVMKTILEENKHNNVDVLKMGNKKTNLEVLENIFEDGIFPLYILWEEIDNCHSSLKCVNILQREGYKLFSRNGKKCTYISEKLIMSPNKCDSCSVFMITDYGYKHVVDNCLSSMTRCGFDKKIKIYCIDDKTYEYYKGKGFQVIRMSDVVGNFEMTQSSAGEITKYMTEKFNKICHYKMAAMQNELKGNEYSCYIDGDIVIEDKNFLNYCLDEISGYDYLFQSDCIREEDEDFLCAGFMVARSTPETLNVYDISNAIEGKDDQDYINTRKKELNYKCLPLHLFPNGRYFMTYKNSINPMLIHFNWVIGNEKIKIMRESGKWKDQVRKYLVTGCSGYIGTELCKNLLNEGNIVYGLDNMIPTYYPAEIKMKNLKTLKNPNFTFFQGDITNPRDLDRVFCEDFDHVIHLAAHGSLSYCKNNPISCSNTNEIGFVNILERCSNMTSFVYASTSAVWNGDSISPQNLYGLSKWHNEIVAKNWAEVNSNVSVTGLRFYTVYGKGSRHDMAFPIFSRLVKSKKSITIFGKGLGRDFVHVDDVVEAIKTSVVSDREGCEVYEVGSGNVTEIEQLAKKISEVLGCNPEIRCVKAKSDEALVTRMKNINKGFSWEAKKGSILDMVEEELKYF